MTQRRQTPADPLRDIDDMVLPFLIDRPGIHGRLARLGPAADAILSAHAYPAPVGQLLGEFLALGATLATALKYDGVFTLQAKGDGPVPLVVADVTSDGKLRGYADVKGDLPDQADIDEAPVTRLLGAGYLALTVDQAGKEDRYQGIVELQGQRLTDCIHHHFQQSDQFSAAVQIAAGRGPGGQWRAGALMIQRLPDQEMVTDDETEDDWRRAVTLMGSTAPAELISAGLPANDLLYRLFHEDGVRVFTPKPLAFGCRCSRDKMVSVLRGIPAEERETLKEDGLIEMTCQFCNASYRFADADIV